MSPARSHRRPAPSPLLYWTLALALLLKAALPMLAATSAGVRGVAVAEVCPVYGVRTAASGARPADGAAPGRSPAAGHAARIAQAGHAGHTGHTAGHGGYATDAAAEAVHAGRAGHAGHVGHAALLAATAGHDPAGDHGPGHDAAGKLHDAGHCSLGALPLAAGAASHGAAPLAGCLAGAGIAAASRAGAGSDATARWVARLKHGPPATA